MPRLINKRGFKIRKGDVFHKFIMYSIDFDGLERILILDDKSPTKEICLTVDDGKVIFLKYGEKCITSDTIDEKGQEEDLSMAKELYEITKRTLDVERKLKNYRPDPNESSLYNYMASMARPKSNLPLMLTE